MQAVVTGAKGTNAGGSPAPGLGTNADMTAVQVRQEFDVLKARELVDGFASEEAPFLDLGEPSWFPTDADRRRYWIDHAPEVVTWAREHGFAQPRAAIRYGRPESATAALWKWSASRP